MITKYTLRTQTTLSYEHDAHFLHRKLNAGIKDIRTLGNYITKLSQLVSFIQQYPDEPVTAAIGAHFADTIKPTVRNYTKRKRTFSIPMLTIWEEDK